MHLTRRSLLMAATSAASELAGLWLDAPAACLVAGLVLLCLLAGLLTEALRRRGRLPTLCLDAPAVCLGEEVRVGVHVAGPPRQRLRIEYLPSLPRATVGPVEPRTLEVAHGSAAQDGYIVHPARLGHLRFPPMRARVLGTYGLAWWPCELAVDALLTVRPGRLSDDERRRAMIGSGGVALTAAGNGLELMQLREYRLGDPLRAIDWRATARSGALVSREFGEERHLEILLVVDAGRYSRLSIDDNDRLGHYAHVAARFAERAVLREDRVGLLVFADRVLVRLPPARGAAALLAVRDALTDVQPADADSDLLGAALAVRRLLRKRSLVVLFTDLDDPRGSGQLSQAVALLCGTHQPLVAGLRSAAVAALSRVRPRRIEQAYEGLAADARTDAMADTLTRLRLSGVPAVLAPPIGYERAVLAAYDRLRSRRRI